MDREVFWTHTKAMIMLDGKDTYWFPNLVATCFAKGDGGDIHLCYRGTNVVTYHPDNTCTLNSGGFRTKTTKDRINTFGPAKIVSQRGVWFVNDPELVPSEFFDGICVDSFGSVVDEYDDERDGPEMTVDSQIEKMFL